jgi:type I restriction enzyme S subunit
MVGWRAYPEYKDSGIEWLGEIPEGWERTSIKYLARTGYKTFTDGDWIESPYITQDGIRLIQTGNIRIGMYREQGFRYISEETFSDFACTEIIPGDVLICRLADPVGRACIAPDLSSRMITSVDVCILKPSDEVDPQFIVYSLSNDAYLEWTANISRGSTRDRISRSMLGDLQLPIPTYQEQRAIASFLDRETARIDALVEKKERQIKLLQEKRSALISHVVTKGLNPDAPMKDSEVKWLGEIPEHWKISKIKYVADMRSGHTPSRKHSEYWENCTIPWFTLADVWQLRDGRREYLGETQERISRIGLEHSSAVILPRGTVIVSRTASVGFSGIMPEPMATSQDFVNWVCGSEVLSAYLLYVFRSMGEEFKRLIMGSTHKTIYFPDASSFSAPVPPLDEQEQVVDFVRSKKRVIDQAEDNISLSIDKLREYRTALISAAVTGKIDVRGEVA